MTHATKTIGNAFALMQALLDNKDSLLKINDALWKRYERLIGSLARHQRHLLEPLLRQFLLGNAHGDAALERLDFEEIETVFALRHLPHPA